MCWGGYGVGRSIYMNQGFVCDSKLFVGCANVGKHVVSGGQGRVDSVLIIVAIRHDYMQVVFLSLPLSGRQGACSGEAESWMLPLSSRGLFGWLPVS